MAQRQRRERAARRGRRKGGLQPAKIFAGAAAVLLVAVIGLRALSGGEAQAAHPEVREGITAEKVVPASAYARYPRIAEVYRMAAEIPGVLDGVYCHCDCSQHAGHYSLLSCFESDHGAGCDICLSEAALAYRMTEQGYDLDRIRAEIDALYGG